MSAGLWEAAVALSAVALASRAPDECVRATYFLLYGNSRTQIFWKLKGSLLSPCACSLIGAPSNFL